MECNHIFKDGVCQNDNCRYIANGPDDFDVEEIEKPLFDLDMSKFEDVSEFMGRMNNILYPRV